MPEPAGDFGTFGALLRRFRLAARLSQEELAARARLSVVSISALERGRRRAPYRETIRLLGDALDLADTQRSELEIAAQRPPLPKDQSAAPTSGAAHDNLPSARTRLIGRDADVAAIVALLREERLVTLAGAGGIGKTRAALAVGNALLASSGVGVWFVDLAPIADGSFVADAVARALGVTERSGHPLAATLLAFLKPRDVVLIFDNCEHVIAAAASLAGTLLDGCARLRILATSREPLRLGGECVVRLPPLAVPTRSEAVRLPAPDAATYGAVALFAERAQAVDRRFVLDAHNVPIIADICRLLDGIALAIELAAARVNVLPPAALLSRLDERFRILTRGERSARPRHQTMRALLDWSYDLLTPSEQGLFARLSVFAGGCDLSEAGDVCSDDATDDFAVFERLGSLVDKSLVMTSSDGGDLRYRLLESARLYAAERLAQHGQTQRIARRHADSYLRLAERLERDRKTAPDAEWLARAEPELENWRAALTWSFGPDGDPEIGQRLVGVLRPVWVSHANAEGRRWAGIALARATPRTPVDVVLKLRFAQTHIALVLGEYAAVLDVGTTLIDACAAAGDAAGRVLAEYYRGGALVSMGRVEEAEPLLTRALAAARTQGNLRLTGLILSEIAYGKSLGDDPAQARPYYAEAIEIWTTIGAPRNAANSTSLLAENAFLAGDLEAALRYSAEAVANLRALRSTRNVLVALNNAATYFNACRRWSEARDAACEALALAQESEAGVARIWALQHLAATAALSNATGSEHDCAAALLGYVDAQLTAHGLQRTGSERREYDDARSVLSAAGGAHELERRMAAGATLAQQHAIDLARTISR